MSPEMIERAARSIVRRNFPSLSEADIDEMWEGYALDATAAIASVADQLREEGARAMQEAAAKEADDMLTICHQRENGRGITDARATLHAIRALSAADIARGIKP